MYSMNGSGSSLFDAIQRSPFRSRIGQTRQGALRDRVVDAGSFECCREDTYSWTVESNMDDVLPFVTEFSSSRSYMHMLGVGDEEGFLTLIDTERCRDIPSEDDENPEFPNCTRWFAHANAIFDIHWVGDDSKLVTASGDRTCTVFDVETLSPVRRLIGHAGSVKSIQSQRSCPNVFVSGSRDGAVFLWDTRRHSSIPNRDSIDGSCYSVKPVLQLHDVHNPQGRARSGRRFVHKGVSSVLFLDGDRVAASAGATDGTVKFWDIRRVNSEKPLGCLFGESGAGEPGSSRTADSRGISNLRLDANGSQLLVSRTNSRIAIYDAARPLECTPTILSGHTNISFYVRSTFSPDGRYVLSGSSQADMYIWDILEPELAPVRLSGHCGEVSGVSWDPHDITRLASCADDGSVRVWRRPKNMPFSPRRTRRKITSADDAKQPLAPKKHLRSRTLTEFWQPHPRSSNVSNVK